MKNSIVYFIVFLGLQAASGLIVKGLWKLITGSTDVTVSMLIASTVLFSILTIAIFLLARWVVVSPAWLRSRQWLVLVWSVVAALGALLPSVWLQEQLPALPDVVEEQMRSILSTRWGYLTVGLLAPLAEEIVFRGGVLRSLLGWDSSSAKAFRPWTAIVISALLFAVAHLNPAQMPHAFLVGLLLGWMYWRTGSILPGMAYHWANNSVAYVLYTFYPNPDLRLDDIIQGGQQHILMAVGFSLLILLPAIYQLHLWMKRA